MGGTTGDLEGNLARLLHLLRSLRFDAPDVDGLRAGQPAAALSILRHAFLRFSRHVTRCLLAAGHELQAKDDARFAESALKALRVSLGCRPALLASQVMAPSAFAEQKLLLCIDALQSCTALHNDLCREHRQLHARPVRCTDPELLSTAQRARVAPAPAPPPERVTLPPVKVEVLPGTAVRSHVVRAQAARSVAPVFDAGPLLTRDAGQYVTSSAFERSAPAQPSAADSRLSEALLASAEINSRLRDVTATLHAMEARLSALEAAAPTCTAAEALTCQAEHGVAVYPLAPSWVASTQDDSAALERSASRADVSRPAREDLHAFIDAINLRFEETRQLLASV